jgi:hypothetical protein
MMFWCCRSVEVHSYSALRNQKIVSEPEGKIQRFLEKLVTHQTISRKHIALDPKMRQHSRTYTPYRQYLILPRAGL